MPGTPYGGAAAALTNKRKYGDDFYQRIGAMGGKRGKTGGFAAKVPCDCDVLDGPHLIRQCAGRIGGIKSRRTKKENV